jgi:2-haloacid dehalogenase
MSYPKKASIAVFDVGKVLIDFDQRNLYRKVFADADKMERFLSDIWPSQLTLELDRGLPFADAIAERVRLHPHLANEIELYDPRWMEILIGPIQGSVALLERLHKNSVELFCITNFPAQKFELAKTKFPFLNLFKGEIVSGREGLVKPDAAIFELLLDRYNLDPTDCLFIDDVPVNVEAARKIGMLGHQFVGAETLAQELQRHNFAL